MPATGHVKTKITKKLPATTTFVLISVGDLSGSGLRFVYCYIVYPKSMKRRFPRLLTKNNRQKTIRRAPLSTDVHDQ